MTLASICLAVLIIIFSVWNMIPPKERKCAVVWNSILFLILTCLVVFGRAEEVKLARAKEKYEVLGREYAGHFYYERTEGEYYIIRETAFLAESEEIAVPKDKVELPRLAKRYPELLLCCEKDTELYQTTVSVNDTVYPLADSVVELRTPYFGILMLLGTIDLMLLAVFNVGYRTVLMINKRRNKLADKN